MSSKQEQVSQEWKSGEMSGTSTGRPVSNKLVIDIDMDSDRHRIELFSKVTIILEQCNARNRQTFYDLENVYVFDIGSICIHGKELLRGKDHTLKQMFDLSEKLIVDKSDENFGVPQISWEDFPWQQLSLVNDEEVSLSHAKVYVLSDSVLCLGKVNQNTISNTVWEEKLSWFKDSSQYRTLDTTDGEPLEFESNIFPGFTALQLVDEVQKFRNKMGDPPEQFKGRIIFTSMFNDISWRTKRQ